ncbi:MAG: preprotein translocase subunit SecG [bacterium]
MHIFLIVAHIVSCVLLILIVLLQAGRSGGLGGIFGGGGGNDALFSAPSGSAFLKKLTTTLAIMFMFTSFILTFLSSREGMKTVTGMPPIQTSPAQPTETGE